MPAPIVVKLSRQITVIDQNFSELKVREPTGRDLMQAGETGDGYGFLARVAANCANLPLDAFEKLPARDALALTRVISDFLGEPTLEASSTATSSAPAGGGADSNSSSV